MSALIDVLATVAAAWILFLGLIVCLLVVTGARSRRLRAAIEDRADVTDWRRIRQLEWELSGRFYHRLDGSTIPEGHADARRKMQSFRTLREPYDDSLEYINRPGLS